MTEKEGLKVVNMQHQIDPEAFRASAKDEKGHTERLQCRVQPAIAQQISAITSTKAFPYRTQGDLVRHGVYRHVLQYLPGLLRQLGSGGMLASIEGQVDIINMLLLDEKRSREFEGVFENISRQVTDFMMSGAEGQARRVLLKVKTHIMAMPDGYWKEKYLKHLEDRWGMMMKEGPRAKLLDFSGSE